MLEFELEPLWTQVSFSDRSDTKKRDYISYLRVHEGIFFVGFRPKNSNRVEVRRRSVKDLCLCVTLLRARTLHAALTLQPTTSNASSPKRNILVSTLYIVGTYLNLENLKYFVVMSITRLSYNFPLSQN